MILMENTKMKWVMKKKITIKKKKAEAESETSPTFPSSGKIYAYVKMGYDRSMKEHLESQGTDFKTWIDSVMTHVQTHYKHKTLPVKILFKYKHSETVFRNENLPSTKSLNNWS